MSSIDSANWNTQQPTPDRVAALAQMLEYCELEARDLRLSFVGYLLKIAGEALQETSGNGSVDFRPNRAN